MPHSPSWIMAKGKLSALLFPRAELPDPSSPYLPGSWEWKEPRPGSQAIYLASPPAPFTHTVPWPIIPQHFTWAPEPLSVRQGTPETCCETQMKCWNHPIQMLHKLQIPGLEILGKDAFLCVCWGGRGAAQNTSVCTHCPQLLVWCSPDLCGFTHNRTSRSPTCQPIFWRNNSCITLTRHFPAKIKGFLISDFFEAEL